MRICHIIFAFFIAVTMAEYGMAKSWRGIVPLKSNRADVERLLGPSTGDPPRYYLPEHTVYFQYAKCRCGEKCKNDDWNVSPDTVISIMVGMKGVVRLADLKVDLTDFKKWPGDEDVPGSFIYKNDEDGFAIRGGGDYVSSLTYFPPAKDDHLRCPRDSRPLQRKGNEWRGIVPLHSTREDVEQLLGSSSGFCKCLYKTDAENIRVNYSIGRCGQGERSNSDVPPDTVLGVTVHPKNRPLLCELEVDIKKLKKTEDPELRGTFWYDNDEEGITYYVLPDGRIQSVTYFGSRKDRTAFQCPKK